VLDAAGLAGCFRATVSGDEVARGKPAPDVYLEAARRLGVEAAESVAVEDSTNGLLAAIAAGMLVVALPNPEFPPEQEALSRAALIVHSLDELTPDAIFAAVDARLRRA
jgi:beta-phosphoglucomutase-like phosphatase (HAD superfamily)